MNLLHSIEEVERVFDTGDKPLLVHCNDLNDYVCKYSTSKSSAENLLREYLGSSFAKLWGLHVPDFNFVQLKKEHVPKKLGIHNINFDCPCFGSQYAREAKEVDTYQSAMGDPQKKRYADRMEFLTLAFFDLWIANDDRNPAHYNLLVKLEVDGYHFVPIDHAACFNTGNLHRGLYPLPEESSILSSPLLFKFFRKGELCEQPFLDDLRKKNYLCNCSCKDEIQSILEGVPPEWAINRDELNEDLITNLLSEKWFDESYNAFLELLQIQVNKPGNGNSL